MDLSIHAMNRLKNYAYSNTSNKLMHRSSTSRWTVANNCTGGIITAQPGWFGEIDYVYLCIVRWCMYTVHGHATCNHTICIMHHMHIYFSILKHNAMHHFLIRVFSHNTCIVSDGTMYIVVHIKLIMGNGYVCSYGHMHHPKKAGMRECIRVSFPEAYAACWS